MKNPFVHFLELLGVKHTKRYSNRVYNEHPYKNSLYSFSSLLSEYSVENVTVQLLDEDKDIKKLEVPVIVSCGSEIGIISKIENDSITLTALNNINVKISIDQFNELWDGITLFAEAGSKSIEPHYQKHKLSDLFNSTQKYILLLFSISLILSTVWTKELYLNSIIMLLLVINLAGVFVSYLLILKHYKIQSNYADKICSLIQKGDCNDVLDSSASKLFGLIGWSEVGMSYFVSNCIILLFNPELLPLLAVVNVCTLPYSFWSVWYQKYRVNSWCTLCLIVQGLLWLIFIVNMVFGYFNPTQDSLVVQSLVILSCIYIIPFIIVNQLLSLIIKKNKMENITQEFNSLKANDDVIKAILSKQSYVEVDKSSSQILFGNKDAEILITILTNPHCTPCARMHSKISDFLSDKNSKFCIQYIFSSFGEEFDMSSKFMIAIYLNNPIDEACEIYHEWFTFGRINSFSFFQKYKVTFDEYCINEFNKHNEWRKNSKLSATPTVLINGYKLPKHYNIEDIRFFTTIDF
ncbi:MAG: hypothetical protein LBF62_13515 [Tannerellaceae bacterium]|jgi:hypothetical protein|nr:hypothetical protein [Tannerellaceae bacterium]